MISLRTIAALARRMADLPALLGLHGAGPGWRSEHRQHGSGGLGRQVLRFALDQAWHRGCYKVLLQAGSRDPGVHRFYEACGFSASEKTGFVARLTRGGTGM